MRVEIWSDVVCPWCYIGKRRFETALANLGDAVDVEYVYRPYQLDPTASPGKVEPVSQAYAKKFGGPERAAQMIANVTNIAADAGIEFNMDKALRANTLLCHRALWYAESIGGPQAALKERLMQAYFTDGENISDPDVVVRCAVDVGIDGGAIAAFLDGDGGVGEVNELLAQAHAHGITAVPTFVIEGQWAIPGAQDVEVFERVLTKLAARDVESED